LFEELLRLLENLTDQRPVALVIEDAHWADRCSRELPGPEENQGMSTPDHVAAVLAKAEAGGVERLVPDGVNPGGLRAGTPRGALPLLDEAAAGTTDQRPC
jgi:hypothetical protein